MNTKKTLLALVACVAFIGTSCTSTSTADEDSLYNTNSVDRTKVKLYTNGVDRTKVKLYANG